MGKAKEEADRIIAAAHKVMDKYQRFKNRDDILTDTSCFTRDEVAALIAAIDLSTRIARELDRRSQSDG